MLNLTSELMPDLTQAAGWMPIVFLVVMGLAMLAYVILDGYDLGVGVLMRTANDDDKDTMVGQCQHQTKVRHGHQRVAHAPGVLGFKRCA